MKDDKDASKGFEESPSNEPFESPAPKPLKRKKQSDAFEAALNIVELIDTPTKH